jgi:hypothetical protein
MDHRYCYELTLEIRNNPEGLQYTLAALKFGLSFFGAFTVLGVLAATAIFLYPQ